MAQPVSRCNSSVGLAVSITTAPSLGGVVRLSLTSPAHGRYVLVWFTRLPTDSSGTFQASVHGVTLQGHG